MSQAVEKEWFTIKEASEITGRTLNAVRLLVHRKKISNVKKMQDNGRSHWMIHVSELGALSSASSAVQNEDKCSFCNLKRKDDPSICREICGTEASSDICREQKPAESAKPAFVMEGRFSGDAKTASKSEIYVASIPLDHYEKRQKEWEQERDRLLQGIILYKLKYEDLEGRVKALPAPPEYMTSRITELEERLEKEGENRKEMLDEVIKENHQVRNLYENQISQLRRQVEKEEQERDNVWQMLKEKEEEIARIKRPWWKKLMGV